MDPLTKFRTQGGGRSLAIKAKCVECVGTADTPGFRKDIRECDARSCPLWEFRPYQRSGDDSED